MQVLGPTLTAPTPPTADNSSKVATTAFVKAQGYGAVTPASSADALQGTRTDVVMTPAASRPAAILAALIFG